jgi:hypothetical protein
MKSYFFIPLILVALLLSACFDHIYGSATVTFVNRSQYDVTELRLESVNKKREIELLAPGDNSTLILDSLQPEIRVVFFYDIDGIDYGALPEAEITTEYIDRYKPSRQITDGDSITVNIYNDHWEYGP